MQYDKDSKPKFDCAPSLTVQLRHERLVATWRGKLMPLVRRSFAESWSIAGLTQWQMINWYRDWFEALYLHIASAPPRSKVVSVIDKPDRRKPKWRPQSLWQEQGKRSYDEDFGMRSRHAWRLVWNNRRVWRRRLFSLPHFLPVCSLLFFPLPHNIVSPSLHVFL